jgi:putative peptide zinc metalloprotease protein
MLSAAMDQKSTGSSNGIELLPLREDLVMLDGRSDPGGSQNWLIYDGLRHRYIEIDEQTFNLLTIWRQSKTTTALAETASLQFGVAPSAGEIEGLAKFLRDQDLVELSAVQSWKSIKALQHSRRESVLMAVVHRYLFFKIPLFAPEPFLRASAWAVAPLFSRRVQVAILVLGAVGLHLVSRQWDEFFSEARGLQTAAGATAFAVTLFVVKALHELGHAYTARRYRCQVPTIGLAFMMMAPLLYTDVTDAWRLKDLRQRLRIDAAGIIVEIGLACIATFVWVLLPDGLSRHIAFLIATTSWTMSVAINLNPFMRFDGYYILSDLLGIANLQSRAFDLGLWRLRNFLFGLKVECPETLPPHLLTVLVSYAWGVWVYRLILFSGIAFIVYAYFFKALGVILFLFEIGYFIAGPVVREFKTWWHMRSLITRTSRSLISAGAFAAGIAVLVLPWSESVAIPAILESSKLVQIYPIRAAEIVSVHVRAGQDVKTGDLLLVLQAADIAVEENVARVRLDEIRSRLNRQAADGRDRSDSLILEGEGQSLAMRLEGLTQERAELEVRAPSSGTVVELGTGLHPGRWVSTKDPLALINASQSVRVSGYVSENDLPRLPPHATGRFTPEVPTAPSFDIQLEELAISGAASIDVAGLASVHGGAIDVQPDAHQRLVPTTAQYLVTMSTTSPPNVGIASSIRGTAHLTGTAESAVSRLWRRVLKVLVRESSA